MPHPAIKDEMERGCGGEENHRAALDQGMHGHDGLDTCVKTILTQGVYLMTQCCLINRRIKPWK